MEQNKIVFISWAPYCSRSDNIARELGGKSHMVYFESLGSNYYTIALKYLLQAIKTMILLLREKPGTVFVMSPSVFASIPVFVYCQFFGSKYIIDAHTGAMKNPMWRRVAFLQKFFCRKALFTIVTNNELARCVTEWGGKYKIVPDVPIHCDSTVVPEFNKRTNVVFVNTFASDEPLLELLEASKYFDDVDFYVTGKINRYDKGVTLGAGSNVVFTDFLPNDRYYGLLQGTDIVVVLTKKDNTMQRGAYEAIYMGKPVVTSDWQILRENFHKGAVFVDNSIEGIVEGIKTALKYRAALSDEAQLLRLTKLKNWQANKKEMLNNFKAA